MALGATGVIEVRIAGSDDNGGGFNPGGSSPGTDYSQQDAPQVVIDGVTITATVHTTTTQLNITGHTVSADDNRNYLQITGGTATAGVYEIVAVDVPNNRWQVDRAAGTSTQTATGNMGGAFATPGKVGGIAVVGGLTVHVKAGTYSIGGGAANTSGNRVSLATGRSYWYGYQTARFDGGTSPVLDATAASISVFTNAVAGSLVENISITNSGANASVNGFAASQSTRYKNCSVSDCANGWNETGSGGIYLHYGCLASGCTSNGFSVGNGQGVLVGCVAKNCALGFGASSTSITLADCIAVGSTGDGFQLSSVPGSAVNCVAYGSGGDGFSNTGTSTLFVYTNCLAVGSTEYGFNSGSASPGILAVNCAGYDNDFGNTNNLEAYQIPGFVTLSAAPFTNAAGNDFSLNNTAGGGAACRGAGAPSSYPGLSTPSYPDIGASQHQDAGGGGGLVGELLVATAGRVSDWL